MAKFVSWIRRTINYDLPTQSVCIQVATFSNNIGNNISSNLTSTENTGGSHDDTSSKGILELYFDILYRLGLTPSPVHDADEQTEGWKVFHKVIFGIVSILAILHSVDGVKYYSVFLEQGRLEHLLVMGFFMVRWWMKILFILAVTNKWSQAQKAISLATRLEQMTGHDNRNQIITSNAIGAAALGMASLRCIFGSVPWKVWTPTNFVLVRSSQLARSALLWGSDAQFNGTMEHAVKAQYESSITLTSATFGGAGILLDFCGCLHFYASWYLMPSVAVSLKVLTDHFQDTFPSKESWILLNDVQLLSKNLDDIFGIIFKFIHLHNTMVFAYFLFHSFIKVKFDAVLLLAFLDTVFMLAVYSAAWKVAEKNLLVKQYILDNATELSHIQTGSGNVSVHLFLKKLKFNPVGLGKDCFFIDDAFVLKFLCVVGSYFVFMEQRNTGK